MQTLDTPNIVLPLASSYNERGVAGYTHTVTNGEDQRKVNCIYEVAKNQITGKGTLTLSKRPGVIQDTHTPNSYGSSTQSVYLISSQISTSGIGKTYRDVRSLVVNTVPNGGNTDIRYSTNGGNTVILSAASGLNLYPYLLSTTSISNTPIDVIQIRNTSPGVQHQRIFYQNGGGFAEITDVDFIDISNGKMEHMDGFAFLLTTTNLIINSDSNSLANWTASSFLAKQIVTDVPVGLARLNNQILAFGDNTVEAFYNAGNTTGSPLAPIKTLHQRIGLIIPDPQINGGHYYCTIGTNLYFVGRESGGTQHAAVFAYDGQNYNKVSTPYIDKLLSEVISTSFYSVNSFGFHGQKAMAILLTSPNATNQRWLAFFPDWKEWFEFTSSVFSPINNGDYFLGCGSSSKDKLYNFAATDNWQDDGTSYQWLTQFRLPTNGSQRKFMLMYGVDADTDTSTNDLTVELSTDDSKTFTTLGTIDQTQDRKVLFRGGSFRKGHIRLGNTNARPTRIQNFLARIE